MDRARFETIGERHGRLLYRYGRPAVLAVALFVAALLIWALAS